MNKLEKEIENDFVRYARQRGALAVKFEDKARRNAPDRIILCPGGVTLFIEFKRPGEKCRPGQLAYHQMLSRLGFRVWVCETANEAKHILDGCLPK